jgi:hypothetical protein
MGEWVVSRMGWNGLVSIARDQCPVPKFRACGALVVVSTALLSAGTLENGNGKWVFGRMGWNGFSQHSPPLLSRFHDTAVCLCFSLLLSLF